ncbi:MAG: DMT family transporter [Rhizobiaceae bacterium]|nr:DMT family transporter [Rhizobiaceae bacterium]
MLKNFTRPGYALGFFVFAMALIPLNDSFIKLMSSHLSVFQILAMRAVVCLCILVCVPGTVMALTRLSAKTLFKLGFRGLCLVGAMLMFFLPLAQLGLAEVTAIFFTAPLLISLLSVPILGEKLGLFRIGAVLVGLAGVVVIVRPGSEGFTFAYLMPIASAISYATYQIVTRYIRNEASLLSMVVVQNLVYFAAGVIGIVAGALFVDGQLEGKIMGFLTRDLAMPYPIEFLYLLVGGFIVLTLSFASANAYSNVEATLIAPFEYVALPMAIIWGVVFWNDWPDAQSWIGITMILGAGILVIYRENVKSKETASAAPMRAASINKVSPIENEQTKASS